MILHLLMDEKFTSDFIDLVNEKFNENKEHIFLIITKHKQLRYKLKNNFGIVFIRQDIKSLFLLVRYMKKTDKIFIHGLFNHYLVYMIFFLHIAHKVIWAIWGGDLYDYKEEKLIYKYIKRKIISKFYGATTPVEGDVVLARKWYGFQGVYYPCMLYLSNVIEDNNEERDCDIEHRQYTILIGNSADNGNRHEYILDKIKMLNLKNVEIVLPLSYGSQQYADKIENAYTAQYGENVVCLRKFMPKKDYLKLLSRVDVVLFAHQRQQGVGNLVQLINIGAKIYMENYITTYKWLKELGIKVFDFSSIDDSVMIPLSIEEKENNRKIIQFVASKDNLIKQLRNIFTD